MTREINLKNNYNLQEQLYIAKTLLYDKCGINFHELLIEEESDAYGACTFKLNELNIKFRISKITPTKTGQFVSIWKRNVEGITEPFNLTDNFDFIIISSQKENNSGQFIFSKAVLHENGIISGNNKDGKRGIRVYPPWDKAQNRQAIKTQIWQSAFFVAIKPVANTEINLAKHLLGYVEK